MDFMKAPRMVSDETRQLQEAAAARASGRKSQVGEREVHRDLSIGIVRAKYKIEVFFGKDRTIKGPNVVQLQFFQSGMKLHGGGDDLMFLCRNEDGTQGCRAFIPSDAFRGGIAICPSCQKAIKGEAMAERLIANFSTKQLAEEISKFWRQLGCSADIYCKYDPTDIRYKTMVEKFGTKKAKKLRGMHIYPLRNILQDTAAGASLENRVFAFLTA
jgi:hypothetical protein